MQNTPDGNQTCQDELHLEKVAFDLFIFKFLASYFNLNLKKHQILFRLLTATIQWEVKVDLNLLWNHKLVLSLMYGVI